MHRSDIVVVGAGIAGLTCARGLVEQGMDVVVIDKARGPGGRCATRRGESGQFDIGAQYFNARDKEFQAAVGDWVRAGVVARWDGVVLDAAGSIAQGERYVGVPRMSALTRWLADGLDVILDTRIESIQRVGEKWLLKSEGAKFTAQAVVLALPAPQAAALLPEASDFGLTAQHAVMAPCWAAMVSFDEPLKLKFDAAEWRDDGAIAWAACDSAKPGRPTGHNWVLHSSADWARRNIDVDEATAAERLLLAFRERTAITQSPTSLSGHRWRYARVERRIGVPCLWDPKSRLGLCGDWLLGGRVEAAWMSGNALSHHAGLRRPGGRT